MNAETANGFTKFQSLAQLIAALDSATANDLIQLSFVIAAPKTGTGILQSVQIAQKHAATYVSSLKSSATTEAVRQVQTISGILTSLEQHSQKLSGNSPRGLNRRLSKHPFCAFALSSFDLKLPERWSEGIGAELLLALTEQRQFSAELANLLRRRIDIGDPSCDKESGLSKKLESRIRKANLKFSHHSGLMHPPTVGENFDDAVSAWFRSRQFFASLKDEQQVFHARTQASQMFLASASHLRKQVESGCMLSAKICIGSILGLRHDLIESVPLLRAETHRYLIAVDPSAGTVYFHRELFGRDAASAPVNCDFRGIQRASDTFVTPLPMFLHEQLLIKFQQHPNAVTLGELLRTGIHVEATTPTLPIIARQKPSYARFRNTLIPFGVSCGCELVSLSILVKNSHSVPHGKFYYLVIDHKEIWHTANMLFLRMGWGEPVPAIEEVSAGCQRVPTEAGLSRWLAWMSQVVEKARPSKSPELQQLLDFHNTFVRYAGSLISFLLIIRRCKVLPLESSMLLAHGAIYPLLDKKVGRKEAARPVVVPETINALLSALRNHYKNMAHYCREIDFHQATGITSKFDSICRGEDLPLLVLIDKKLEFMPLGSDDLEKWWPSEFGIFGNSGRYFFQNSLRKRGLPSTLVDVAVRHFFDGSETYLSTGERAPDQLWSLIRENIDALADQLGIQILEGVGMVRGIPK